MGLVVENVSKSYTNKKAVEKISFQINKPGVFGLLGTNGAGKTTTIRMILGIISKDSGSIKWNGNDVDRKYVNFGYMPEERGVYPKTKIFDQLMYFCELKGMNKDEAKASIIKWSKKLEVEEYLNVTAEKLSKGNQQKIQFIIAVMHNPELIVLDEPFSGLDPINTELLKNIILELVEEGKYIIMSSHQMASIEEFCSDILILNKGKTILKGNLKEIKNSYPSSNLEIQVNTNIDDVLRKNGLNTFTNLDNNYKIKIENESKTDELLKDLVNSNFKIIKYELQKPSLNEIFIERVGE